jgi:hypothetical protein
MLDIIEQIRHISGPKFSGVLLSFVQVLSITLLSASYIFALRFLTNKILRYLYV